MIRSWLNARLAGGEWLYRITHAVVFRMLSANARSHLRRHAIRHTQQVFGLLQNGRVDERFVLGAPAETAGGEIPSFTPTHRWTNLNVA